MLYRKSVDDDCLPPADLARLIACCDRFEAAWNSGQRRRIEDDIAVADETIRERLFRELLALELELVHRDGGAGDRELYIARFPDRADAVGLVFGSASNTNTATFGQTTTPGLLADSGDGATGYEIIRKLGGGGQAVTYLARDRALHRLVVLKRYHGAGSSSRREAVLHEGRALARVRSPFVAPCYGVEAQSDEIDLVVEYVPGRPLTELSAAERADSMRSARLVEQVASGLAEVHACGLLHRDIKPHNIILGDDGLPRLVDFGVAVPLASDALHTVAGSPPYMAPEQARGQGERVDARTDVFGLGAVLYYLLTGVPPHDGDTVQDVIQQAQGAPIVPPRQLNRRIPRGLERICLKAMAADPQARFQSAEAFRRALGNYQQLRRATPVLAAVAILLAALVPVWALWPQSARTSGARTNERTAGSRSTEPRAESPSAPLAELRVTRFEIPLFGKLDEQKSDPNRTGLLGRTSFTAREDDDVAVQAELSEPAYSYLIVFRPDGTDELCDPEDEDEPPSHKRQPAYPPPAKSNERYRLSEGTGLYAFALVVSRQPLPAYREWKKRVAPFVWGAKLPSEPGVVWRYDKDGIVPLVADDGAGTRSKGAKSRDSGGPASRLANWLRGLPGIDVVTVEAFSVEKALKN
jgi:serine/threonine protein kinase